MKPGYKEIIGQLGAVSSGELRSAFDDVIRGVVRSMVVDIMATEVTSLCGPAYLQERSATHRRAGSATGVFEYGGLTEGVKRPRVRRKGPDGKEEEVGLVTYAAARDTSSLQQAVIRAISGGVSSRDLGDVLPKGKGLSKSSVSRLWVTRGAELLKEFKSQDLGQHEWLAIMIDGIVLGEDLTAVVALGVTSGGRKIMLDFEIGSSESYEVCKGLLQRVKDRGFKPAARRLLAVTDGGKGLRKAVKEAYPDVVLQRCLVHKERNIRAYLSRKHHGALAGLFNSLRRAQTLQDAQVELKQLRDFLAKHSQRALESLEEAGDELLAFQALGVPNTLNTTFLNTNCIENSFRNVRRKIGRVKRWRSETEQPQRWMAYALLEVGKGFKRIRGYQMLDTLMQALNAAAGPANESPLMQKGSVDKKRDKAKTK